MNTIQAQGTWETHRGTLNQNFEQVAADLLKLKTAAWKTAGFFGSAAELAAVAGSEGAIAYVGTAAPYDIYAWDGSEWKATGEKYSPQVDIDGYATQAALEAEVSARTEAVRLEASTRLAVDQEQFLRLQGNSSASDASADPFRLWQGGASLTASQVRSALATLMARTDAATQGRWRLLYEGRRIDVDMLALEYTTGKWLQAVRGAVAFASDGTVSTGDYAIWWRRNDGTDTAWHRYGAVDLSEYATTQYAFDTAEELADAAEAAAKRYADGKADLLRDEIETGDSGTLQEAETYADNKDASTLAAAKSYADGKATNLQAQIDALGTVFRVRGSSAWTVTDDTSALYQSVPGDVWNITEAFTLGGVLYPAGTNVVCVAGAMTPDYNARFDALSGAVDLSGYATTQYVDTARTSVETELDNLEEKIETDYATKAYVTTEAERLDTQTLYNAMAYTDRKDTSARAYTDQQAAAALRPLYEAAGAVWNAETGFYELNGLTDITEAEMAKIYAAPSFGGGGDWGETYRYFGCRTNLCNEYGASTSNRPTYRLLQTWAYCAALEVAKVVHPRSATDAGRISFTLCDRAFFGSRKLRRVIGVMGASTTAAGQISNMFTYCDKLEDFRLFGLKYSLTLGSCPLLSLDTLRYLVDNAANTAAITVTVHADVYQKLTGGSDAEWAQLAQDAAARSISFASA